ncbi:hypothetical protein ARSEF4850_008510 [Beauveria asiatica]
MVNTSGTAAHLIALQNALLKHSRAMVRKPIRGGKQKARQQLSMVYCDDSDRPSVVLMWRDATAAPGARVEENADALPTRAVTPTLPGYIAIVLTAMQAGLATEFLGHNHAFQAASYGLTMFSILGPLVAASAIMLQFCGVFVWNWARAVRRKTARYSGLRFS